MHRDLKPKNLMFEDTTNLKIKILDFGLSEY